MAKIRITIAVLLCAICALSTTLVIKNKRTYNELFVEEVVTDNSVSTQKETLIFSTEETSSCVEFSTTTETTLTSTSACTAVSQSKENLDIYGMVKEICHDMDFDEDLVLAVIKVESNFNPNAYGGGCYGLMAISSVNFGWLRNLGYEPTTVYGNIQSGTYILKMYADKYGDYNKALMCYNCGEGGASKLWRDGIYSTGYSKKVMNYYGNL